MEWSPNPIMFEVGGIEFSWYGSMFTIGLFFAYLMTLCIFSKEGRSDKNAFLIFIFIYVGAVVGARLGHCFFYEADYYLHHLNEVLYFWKGGLASHGAVIGISIALWIYSKVIWKMPFFELGDKIIAGICLVAAFVRIGNLMNSEIVGKTTSLPWAFVFERVDNLSRHPTQIYEAVTYFILAIFLWFSYHRGTYKNQVGKVSGYFFIMMFLTRFFIEFFKENHTVFEDGLFLNMGQILSIPFIILGFFLVVRTRSSISMNNNNLLLNTRLYSK